MQKDLLIRPNGPEAIVQILLNHYYSTRQERKNLVNALLSERTPRHLEAIAKLLSSEDGRKCVGVQFLRACQILALWAHPRDCLLVHHALPLTESLGRLELMRSIIKLGRALVDDRLYREKFEGRLMCSDERKLLLKALGQEVLVERLLRSPQKKPPVWLATATS